MPLTLIFHIAWLDTENDFHRGRIKRTFRMLSSTRDDTVIITETTPGFNNALFLRCTRLPYLSSSNFFLIF